MKTRKIVKKILLAAIVTAATAGLSSCMGLDSVWFGTDFNSGPGGPIVGGSIGVPIGPGPGGPGYPGAPGLSPGGPGPGPGILPGRPF
ncbi:MAG: hypothetical protein NC127_06420 [Muribaculum sp.]|nr:hypothetical protein [Muribaculum sp.]